MKRDLDLVRQLLLKIEARHQLSSADLSADGSIIQADHPTISYHLTMMVNEAGLARGIAIPSTDDDESEYWEDLVLTWQGHDFLDQVRDDEIWRLTKDGASKARGFSFDLLASLAKGLIRERIKKYTSFDVDI